MEKTETKETMIQITMKGNGVITVFIQDNVSPTSGWRALRQEFLVFWRSLPFTAIFSATIPRKTNAHFSGLSASPAVSFPVFTGGIVLFLAHELARHSLRISLPHAVAQFLFPLYSTPTICKNFLGSSYYPHTSCVSHCFKASHPKDILPQIGRHR